jgi:hypothetical protein
MCLYCSGYLIYPIHCSHIIMYVFATDIKVSCGFYISPASPQSTYCSTLIQHAAAINRSVQVVNPRPSR